MKTGPTADMSGALHQFLEYIQIVEILRWVSFQEEFTLGFVRGNTAKQIIGIC